MGDVGRYGNYFVAVIFFSTILMIVYFWRVIEIMYIRHETASSRKPAARRIEELPASMLYSGLLLGVMSFILGILWISGILNPVITAINHGFGLGGRP